MSRSIPPGSGQAGTLLFFSNTIPTESSGSFIVFRRHLLPLVQAGWRLVVLSYFPAPAGENLFWTHVQLPLRKAFWPPANPRFHFLMRLRARLLRSELRRQGVLRSDRPTVLLANLWDPQALVAAACARSGDGRLGVFVHDDEILWNREDMPPRHLEWNRRQVANAADLIWPVSERLVQQFDPANRAKCHMLRPISATDAWPVPAWQPRYAERLELGYAGKIYPGLWPLLKRLVSQLAALGGRLTLITDAGVGQEPWLPPPPHFRILPYFPRAEDSARWLRENCSALLVAHPLYSDIPPGRWQILQSSFPSKLVEYVRFGLPLVLIGDENSEFGAWARRHPELPFFSAAKSELFGAELARLQNPDHWLEAALRARQLAEGEFDPARLQAAFVADLERLARPGHATS